MALCHARVAAGATAKVMVDEPAAQLPHRNGFLCSSDVPEIWIHCKGEIEQLQVDNNFEEAVDKRLQHRALSYNIDENDVDPLNCRLSLERFRDRLILTKLAC